MSEKTEVGHTIARRATSSRNQQRLADNGLTLSIAEIPRLILNQFL